MKVIELQEMLDIMPEDGEITQIHISPDGIDEESERLRYHMALKVFAKGVTMTAEGTFLSLKKKWNNELRQTPFANLKVTP